jgi:hypothetical protein
VKHRHEPMRAMMRSKDGKTTAMKTIRTMIAKRTKALPIMVDLEMWVSGCWLAGERPQRTSTVVTRGRALVLSVSCFR